MKKRFSIIVLEHANEYELCQCDSNPEQIVKAAALQTTLIGRVKTRKYVSVRFIDNHKAEPGAEVQIEMPWS
jgi:hypothetical protein